MEETLIDPRELRIGSILSYKEKNVQVTFLSLDIDDEYQELIGFVELGKTSNEKMDWNRALCLDLKRIPLTPESLIKWGFLDKGPNDSAKSNWGKEGVRCPSFDSFEGAFYCTDDWGAEYFAYCEFVHQFQNAYFALTGTELEIKLL